MEQFENQQPKNAQVKEKSVYLLHLDGARILILSAITIGLLTVAFLIGMKLTGDTGKESLTAQNDALVDQSIVPQGQDPMDPSKSSLPDLATANNTGGNNTLPQIANNTASLPDLPVSKNNELSKVHDAVTADDNHIVIPPAKEVARTEKIASKPAKKKADKKESARKKKEVREVSSESASKTEKSIKSGYVLQVASYDKMDIAKKEVSSLKSMSYDAFVDKSSVKGKNFFRVRIGPIASKDKAIQMLNDIQSNERYAESYVVKE